VVEREQQFYELQDAEERNPYVWQLDLCRLTLGNFHYRKMSLVRDYDALLAGELPSEAFEAIFSPAPRQVVPAGGAAPPLADSYHVVPCDPTQATSLAAARSGRSYIVQGPPGTGKSQTITNLIADAVARGQRVLFVCEKRAALDVVYHRLRQQGLDRVCCLIHDAQSDKRAVIDDLRVTHEALLAGEEGATVAERRRERLLAELERELAPLAHFDHAMREVAAEAGVATHELLRRLLELRHQGVEQILAPLAELTALQRERLPAYREWVEHGEAVARLAERVAELAPPLLAVHPLRLLASRLVDAERPQAELDAGLRQAEALLAEVLQAFAGSGLPRTQWDALPAAAELAAYATTVEPLVRRGRLDLLDPDRPVYHELREQVRAHARRSAELVAAAAGTGGWHDKLELDETRHALLLAQRLEGSALAVLRPAWWRLRRVLRERYDFARHAVAPRWSLLLAALERELQAQGALRALESELAISYDWPEAVGELATLVRTAGEVEERSPAAAELRRRALAGAEGRRALLALAGTGGRLDGLQATLDTILDTRSAAAEGLGLGGIATLLREVAAALAQLPDFLPCLAALRELPPRLQEALRRLPLPFAAVEAASGDETLRAHYRRDRALQRFAADERDRLLRRAGALHAQWHQANAEVVLARVRARFRARVRVSSLPAAQLGGEEKELKKRYARGRRLLEHELGKTMRHRSLRDLLTSEAGEVMQDLKPVWLMSPLSVSDALPLDDQHFDLVIFDEASQIPLEEAVPAIHRARQSIVVGDQMQLPPTNFFSARDRDEEELVVEEESGEKITYELDSDSFLEHAARVLPATLLGWHYRSRSEALIGFSNAAFYAGRLLTVPEHTPVPAGAGELRAESPADAAANLDAALLRSVSFHFLPGGIYEERRNRAEAAYIAELVRALLRREEVPTIGVVAFSEAQQGEIEAALERLAEADEAFRERLEAEYEREEDGQFAGLLVKNLENVQGDERDVVLLSVCYGPNAERRTRMAFGPINQSGGERRLNVAFSRAKRHMMVVSSIRHGDIRNDYNDGAAALKGYLRYAEAISGGRLEEAQRVLRELLPREAVAGAATGEPEPVVAQLAAALRARGWEVNERVGQSWFRCDLAVRRGGEGSYRAAVQVDTRDHYREGDLLARDLLKPDLLRAFGWRVTSVLTKEWYHQPEAVLARLEAALAE
jgi:hypothetical protein